MILVPLGPSLPSLPSFTGTTSARTESALLIEDGSCMQVNRKTDSKALVKTRCVEQCQMFVATEICGGIGVAPKSTKIFWLFQIENVKLQVCSDLKVIEVLGR